MPIIMDTTINWDSNITKVLVTEAGGIYEEYTYSGRNAPLFANRTYTANVTLNSGYIIDSVTSNSTNTTISDITENTFTFINSIVEPIAITITSKSSVSKVFIDLTTLTGWDNVTSGEHTIQVVAKATGYLDSEKSTAVSFTKASTTTGETWILKSDGMTAPDNEIDETINFHNAANDNFTRINIYSEGKGVHISYFNNSTETDITTGGTGVTGDNATITFETAPTGDLLTWLQANGTKQGGTTAHTLTWSDQYSYAIAITVNGNEITSPYTLQNGDVIKVPTLTKTTINGVSYSTFDESTLNISGKDITIARTGAEKTTSPVPYITINYTE